MSEFRGDHALSARFQAYCLANSGVTPETNGVATWLPCHRVGDGPRTKNGREMGAGSHFSGVFQNGRKMAGQIAGQLEFGDFLPVRPFFGHFGKMATGHFAGHFSASFGSGPVSHSVAGQPSLKNGGSSRAPLRILDMFASI